jgi:predicted TIM-barrel enzyme
MNTQSKPVFRTKPNAIETLFGKRKAVLGMIHCLPLPGAPRYEGQPIGEIVEFAVNEAKV